MKPFIRITRYPYEEPSFLNLVVSACNGHTCGEIEVYASTGDLVVFARELRQFPEPKKDDVIWELGSELPESNFAFHFRIRVYQHTLFGKCAIEVRFCNNQKPPDREVVEFSIIDISPSDLDRFAELLERYSELEHRVLEWNITDGELRELEKYPFWKNTQRITLDIDGQMITGLEASMNLRYSVMKIESGPKDLINSIKQQDYRSNSKEGLGMLAKFRLDDSNEWLHCIIMKIKDDNMLVFRMISPSTYNALHIDTGSFR